MTPLPRIMVAPNGARLTKKDHPRVPVTIPEIVDCAIECQAAGADGIHAHVRDADQNHVLDAGMYRELLAELTIKLPDFYTQITTEAVGLYTPDQQRELVKAVQPRAVSIALREITDGQDAALTARFFHDCYASGTDVQHIMYDKADVDHFARLVAAGDIPNADLKALIVLGRYAPGQKSSPDDLGVPATALKQQVPGVDWAVCAFGAQETACLVAAAQLGGKARIGFENNRLNADLTCAANNAARVKELAAALAA